MAGHLKLKLSSNAQQRLARRDTESVEAHEFYLKGRYFWNLRTPAGVEKAVEFFQQAIERDPKYALAYAGLADCYALQSGLMKPADICPRARAAALKALELDENLAEAHTSLALIKLVYEWDWPGIESECKRAIQLNPNYATAHSVYARYLVAMGRFDIAMAELMAAQERDPLSFGIASALGIAHYQARQYDQAQQRLRAVLSMEPRFGGAIYGLGLTYTETQRFEEAVAAYQQALSINPSDTATIAELGRTYGLQGQRQKAGEMIQRLTDLSRQRYVLPYFIAMPYLGLGETDQALEWLERAIEERCWPMAFLNVEPKFDSLRRNPRFQALCKRVGLT
jgi:tetratricopeptide (TPR) repeat protein